MSEFEAVLRAQVDAGLRTLDQTRRDNLDHNLDHEVHRYEARVRDLLDMAARHGVDTTDWAASACLESASHGD